MVGGFCFLGILMVYKRKSEIIRLLTSIGTFPLMRNRGGKGGIIVLLCVTLIIIFTGQQLKMSLDDVSNTNSKVIISYDDESLSLPSRSCTQQTVMVSTLDAIKGINTRCQREIRYFPKPKLLVAVMAKGGSTTTLEWLYSALTGKDHFDHDICDGWVHNMHSKCWKEDNIGFFLSNMTIQEQEDVLTSNETLRVAIVRDPFERLLSSFKDKISCDHFNKRPQVKPFMIRRLRDFAGLRIEGEEPISCLNISEFANLLDVIRIRHPIQKIRGPKLDQHFRPQDLCADLIHYDTVLNTKDLSNTKALQPIIDRLGSRGGGDDVSSEVAHNGPVHLHHVDSTTILMTPEKAMVSLVQFAMLTPTFYFNL